MFRKKQLLEKTITVVDSKTKDVLEVIDIVDSEPEIITIETETKKVLTDSQEADLTLINKIKEAYPDEKDIEKFLFDNLPKKEDLADADKEKEKDLIDNLTDADSIKQKELQDAAQKEAEKRLEHQREIEKTWRENIDKAN